MIIECTYKYKVMHYNIIYIINYNYYVSYKSFDIAIIITMYKYPSTLFSLPETYNINYCAVKNNNV